MDYVTTPVTTLPLTQYQVNLVQRLLDEDMVARPSLLPHFDAGRAALAELVNARVA